MQVNVNFEEWSGSATLRTAGRAYRRLPAASLNDRPASLSERQAVFYRNLIAVALATRSKVIPVDFEDRQGVRRYFDRGCLKIAEHARFIEQISDDESGVVSAITLNWEVAL
jgi:hypothetical protein